MTHGGTGIWVTDRRYAHALYCTGWYTVHHHLDARGRKVRLMKLRERRSPDQRGFLGPIDRRKKA